MKRLSPEPRSDRLIGRSIRVKVPQRLPSPVLFAVATAFGVSSTIQAYWLERLSPKGLDETIGVLLALNLAYWYVPAVATPFVLALATKYRDRPWGVQALIHVPGALAYASAHSVLMFLMRAFLFPRGPAAGGLWTLALRQSLEQLDWLLMTYLFLVGLAHAMAYRRDSERRALTAAQLETRLVEAQLQALQRQLHPHFLFNTLNTISGLMRGNAKAADLMIEQLGDLLRMTLDSSGAQQVTLNNELEMLRKYLEIEQTRFGTGRLGVAIHVEPDTLDALVPNLLLQPLTENAVRHGIAPFGGPGWIAIHASRIGPQLVLEIRDSGHGVPPERLAGLNHGVGLTNTRARLERLYGSSFQLLFANEPEAFCVTVKFPFRLESVLTEPVCEGVA